MKWLFIVVLGTLLPTLVRAQGIVPCNPEIVDGELTNGCGFCEAGQLIKSISDWFVLISGLIVVIIIIVMGIRVATAVGNVSALSAARKYISAALFGYALVIGAWFVVDTFLKFLIPGSSYGVLNPLLCGG